MGSVYPSINKCIHCVLKTVSEISTTSLENTLLKTSENESKIKLNMLVVRTYGYGAIGPEIQETLSSIYTCYRETYLIIIYL